jgi:SAM-dependent methyltransferase
MEAMTFRDAKQRFSSRVADYVRYRPGYPPALIDLLREECGLRSEHAIADVGSGTGLLSELFLKNGNRVFGIEPNEEMRLAAEDFISLVSNFSNVAGSAEATMLPSASVDFVAAGQAFHWFDKIVTRREFQRILKPSGWVVILRNDLRISETQFAREYEDLLVRFGTDYESVKNALPEKQDMENFFGSGPSSPVVEGLHTGASNPSSSPRGDFRFRELSNFQEFDFAGFAGRLRSSSYAPKEDHSNYAPMMAELERIFRTHEANGRVRMEYATQIYFGRLH